MTAAQRAQGELKQHLAAAQHRIGGLEGAVEEAQDAAQALQGELGQRLAAAQREAEAAKREASAARQVAAAARAKLEEGAKPARQASKARSGGPLVMSVSRAVLAAGAVALLGTAGASVASRRPAGPSSGSHQRRRKAAPTQDSASPAADGPAPATEA